MTTRLVLKDELLDAQLLRAVGAAPAGGAEVGECIATARRISGTDLDSWYAQWMATADAVFAQASAAESVISARHAFFRACTYYRTAGGMLLAAPLDPRLVEANRRQTDAFRRGAALLDVPPEVIEIPYEGTSLPGYFFRATTDSGPRPTLVLTDGYDGTVEDCTS